MCWRRKWKKSEQVAESCHSTHSTARATHSAHAISLSQCQGSRQWTSPPRNKSQRNAACMSEMGGWRRWRDASTSNCLWTPTEFDLATAANGFHSEVSRFCECVCVKRGLCWVLAQPQNFCASRDAINCYKSGRSVDAVPAELRVLIWAASVFACIDVENGGVLWVFQVRKLRWILLTTKTLKFA